MTGGTEREQLDAVVLRVRVGTDEVEVDAEPHVLPLAEEIVLALVPLEGRRVRLVIHEGLVVGFEPRG